MKKPWIVFKIEGKNKLSQCSVPFKDENDADNFIITMKEVFVYKNSKLIKCLVYAKIEDLK